MLSFLRTRNWRSSSFSFSGWLGWVGLLFGGWFHFAFAFAFQEEGQTEEEPKPKRRRELEADGNGDGRCCPSSSSSSATENNSNLMAPTGTRRIETGIFSKIPPELFPHILKFLSSEVNPTLLMTTFISRLCFVIYLFIYCCCIINIYYNLENSQDLVACALVCRFLNYVASDESLWRRLWVSSLFTTYLKLRYLL